MNKAVLILDEMPENCANCPLSEMVVRHMECILNGKVEDDWVRPESCPLKEYVE